MLMNLETLFATYRPDVYARRSAMVLVNGLAEQSESWFRNQRVWRRHFDVHMPNIIAYDGEALQRRIADNQPISVEYLVERLRQYLAQSPPYHLVASSLGGKIAAELAVRYPQLVSRLVLICPSGLGGEERLPVLDGVRRSDLRSMIHSVFFDPRRVDSGLVKFYQGQFNNRRWRLGLLRTIRGTMDHSVRSILPRVQQPTLIIVGREDRIVNPEDAEAAARELPQGQFQEIPNCGHAPQLEKPRLINRLVVRFLSQPQPFAGADFAGVALTPPLVEF
jgi:pimeloyl-ACP methyl ester carboxylesterase